MSRALGFSSVEGQTCADCGVEPEPYLVADDLWHQAGMPTVFGGLCLQCLKTRLGRVLVEADFVYGWPGDPV